MSCSWPFAPKGFALANGQLLPINQNQALFSLLGTTFGGNGVSTFGLPNLQVRTPIGSGKGQGLSSYTLGQAGGELTHILTIPEMAGHNHTLNATGATDGLPKVGGNALGVSPGPVPLYGPAQNLVALNSQAVSSVGNTQPHENSQPYLVINWIISLSGIFPSRN
jgi:microcystin-dependent protein